MNIFIFSIGLILFLILLSTYDYGSQVPLFSGGYLQSNSNPIYYSGNKQQKHKKHNLLRISKLRKKK